MRNHEKGARYLREKSHRRGNEKEEKRRKRKMEMFQMYSPKIPSDCPVGHKDRHLESIEASP